jgi:hypothetical protein
MSSSNLGPQFQKPAPKPVKPKVKVRSTHLGNLDPKTRREIADETRWERNHWDD